MSRADAPREVRPASSLLLLRDGEQGLEVLMLRRAERDGDMRSGAVVFPGGVLDARDREAHACVRGPSDEEASERLGIAAGGLDFYIAALRESFEEVGLLLAAPALPPVRAAALEPWRARLQSGAASIAELCRAEQLMLDAGALAAYSHWLTPPGVGQRFDTRFFAALAPEQQQAVADRGEAVELMWLAPGAALDPARELRLLPVTRRTLQDLSRFARAVDAYGEARERRDIALVMPRRVASPRGTLRVVMPDELAYAEVARLDPEGRGDLSADLAPGRPVRLGANIVRVTAPNASVMTGPGTNTYLVGDGRTWTVIDPGPAMPEHVRALLDAAAPGRVERILVTHTHPDHSPAARQLAEATGAPVYGRRTAHPEWQDMEFQPERELADGERLALAPGVTLRVLHTPGHASNHLCFLLEEEKLLFTGDHVMQGSTVVINPPDGDMAAYLRSLEALLAIDLEWFAPGHGFLVARPHDVLRALIAHRLRREAKVADALRAAGSATLDEMLPRVYDDAPVAIHPVARRSLHAHLIKLAAEGRVMQEGARWTWRG
ncbi:MAG TPA: MBL fold metallo-hydrolase [Rubrivivax sp.]|nr:MBL fold metallo-hydrolase [Rubrivivax sp.]HPP82321.1 MBL fold metallo-hydrolase [Rubrivivax sp.]